jgi:TonB family protein
MKKASAKINEAWPTKRIEPNYPEKAIEENIEGYVVLEFDITETGTTDNIQVVQSSPKGVFDKNALAAFKQWEYKPAIKNGKGVRQQGLLVQLDFKLAPEPLNANASSKM